MVEAYGFEDKVFDIAERVKHEEAVLVDLPEDHVAEKHRQLSNIEHLLHDLNVLLASESEQLPAEVKVRVARKLYWEHSRVRVMPLVDFVGSRTVREFLLTIGPDRHGKCENCGKQVDYFSRTSRVNQYPRRCEDCDYHPIPRRELSPREQATSRARYALSEAEFLLERYQEANAELESACENLDRGHKENPERNTLLDRIESVLAARRRCYSGFVSVDLELTELVRSLVDLDITEDD